MRLFDGAFAGYQAVEIASGVVAVGMFVATCLALAVLALSAHRSREQLRKVAVLLIPAILAGYILVSAPDVLEEMVRFL